MLIKSDAGKGFIAKLTAAALCAGLLSGWLTLPARAVEAEAVPAEDPYSLVDIYCSQTARDALGDDVLASMVDLIVTSIEPQAVNLLIERFPCFKEAAENDEIGREIGLYIFYGEGDQDGIPEHENVAGGAYAYVNGTMAGEPGECEYRYMICIDAESLVTVDDDNNAVFSLDDKTRIQLDTTFCHELFHAFMEDYNRTGMSGYTDYEAFITTPEEQITAEEADELYWETVFPFWFIEGLAGCVGNIYPADLSIFREYHYDMDTGEYLDDCTEDQLVRMYTGLGYQEGTGEDRYDMTACEEDNDDGHVNGAVYVSGYMACLYLADLGYRELEGSGAVAFDENGEIESISAEKLREGLSVVLSGLHEGDTLDEVINRLSDGAYADTKDFTARFIKGTYDEEAQAYAGDPGTLPFCVGYLNYMSRLDAMDPETHPAGSMLVDDFVSTEPTPLEEDKAAASDFYRIIESNVMTPSTVPNENVRDGGTSYSGRDSFDAVVEEFKSRH